ncbi:MAG: MFS transporter [Gammaproteobacteria bacterium]
MNSNPTDTPQAQLHTSLTRDENQTLLVVLGIFVMRMLGLFMLLPVMALYAASMPGATPFLVGLAVGAYGITQAALQIPFGWASDRYGRRRLLVTGLFIFGAGAIVAALSDSITGVIVGRVVQGAGAISAVLSAVIGDTIAEQRRTRAMAFVGISLGMSFLVSLMLGPVISSWVGVKGLFFVSAGLAGAALALALWRIPGTRPETPPNRMAFRSVFKSVRLWQLNVSIFMLHLILAALFVALPFVLRDQFGLVEGAQWKAVGLIILLSIPGSVVLIRRAERGTDVARAARLDSSSIGLIVLSMVALAYGLGHPSINLKLVILIGAVFFSGFNFLEASLPARVSIVASEQQRGTALGAFASCQFLGVFVGGALSGIAMGMGGPKAAFAVCAGAAVLWLVLHLATLPAKQSNPANNVA